jgi:DNA-binding transcriptional LysR family regulator
MSELSSLRQIQYFIVLAEELHFGRAAQQLGLAQPALSQQIQRLEEILDCTLLERRPRVELTTAGKVFLSGCQRVLTELEVTVDSARRAASGKIGSLSIGVVASTLLLPAINQALRLFAESQPEVKLSVAAMDTADQLDALRSGRIELALMRDAVPASGFRYEELQRERLVMAIPSAHPLARRRGLKLAALREEPFILFPRQANPGIHDRITDTCRAAGFEPRVVQEVGDVQTRLGLVAAGLGVTITAASLQRLHDNIRFRNILEPDVWTSVILSSNSARSLSPPAAAFRRTLFSACANSGCR